MTGKYTLIYADPPWVYRDKAADGERGAGFKYPVMNVLDICRLPVWDLAADDCLPEISLYRAGHRKTLTVTAR